jgi:hypothetical protein
MLRPPMFCPPVHFFPPSMAWATPGDHELLIGRAWWRSMGELCLGRSVTWLFGGWKYHQGTDPSRQAGLILIPSWQLSFQ